MEEWREIRNYEGLYLVSNTGKVKNKITGKVLSPRSNGCGYSKVELWKNHEGRNFYIHRLVASAFIENPNGFSEVNHMDGIRNHNDVSNLEWVSSSGNTLHAVYREALSPWGNTAKPIIAISLMNGDVKQYHTISEAERDIGSRHITDVLKGKRSQCKGFTFRYLERGGDAK